MLSNVCKKITEITGDTEQLTSYQKLNLYHQQCILRQLELITKLLKKGE